MSSSINPTLARPYAKAVFQQACDADMLTEWSAVLAVLAQLSADKQVKKLIDDPILTEVQKADFFIDITRSLLPLLKEEVCNSIQLLAENKRLPVLSEISIIYENLRAARENTKKVHVISASSLNELHKETLTAALKKKFNSHIEPTWQIDPSVLGGLIIKTGDFVIDASIRSQLSKLTKEMVEG